MHALVGTLAIVALAACADRTPTGPTSDPSLARTMVAAKGGGGPTRFTTPDAAFDFTLAAGVACSFAVASEPVVNRLVTKEFPADANGDVLQLTTGNLVLRFTNLETGRSITTKVSGPARLTIHPDGSSTLVAVGRWSHLFVGGANVPGGLTFFLTAGRVVIEVSPSGVGTVVSQAGHVEDLCAALS